MSKSPASSCGDSPTLRRGFSQVSWVMAGCAVVMLGIPMGALELDKAWRGALDPMFADSPVDWANPFNGTRSEAKIRASFREPIVTEASGATATPAKSTAAINGEEQSEISPAAMAKARRIYQERCASCHGEKGNGDGPGAFAVRPKPRDYTNAEWQKTVTDEELAKAIVKGGAAVGKSYMMPANYDLRAKPEVAAGLVQIVRSFAKN